MGWVQTKLSDSQQPTPSVPETGKPKPNTNASSVVIVESSAIKETFTRTTIRFAPRESKNRFRWPVFSFV